jgi:hypothetical protein
LAALARLNCPPAEMRLMSDAAPLAPTPIAAPLDDYLREVVQTLHTAVAQGMRHAADNPAAAEPQVADCEDILRVIMAGDVRAWLGS